MTSWVMRLINLRNVFLPAMSSPILPIAPPQPISRENSLKIEKILKTSGVLACQSSTRL